MTPTPRETSASPPSLQAICLQRLLEDKVEVFVYLVSGIRLQGLIGGFDKQTLLLQLPGSAQQLLYKKGISTVVPKAEKR
jgi:host factor-I protein